MEILWIGVAFLLGFAAKGLRQPPMVGYLVAGFVLEFLGFRPDRSLDELADVGVLLLLFFIGLKLDVGSIRRPFVWGASVLHMGITVAVLTAVGIGLSALGVGPMKGMDAGPIAVIAFGLSFSSTIFVMKLLEERDDTTAVYGRTAIGILVVQDLAAVLFIVLSSGTPPSPWALGLILLWPLRPLLGRFLSLSGHGELLTLGGIALTLGAAALFKSVGLKPDLGALTIGVLLGGHPKARELTDSLKSLKDIFLVGFFLKVGLSGLPTWETVAIGVALLPFLLLKGALFFWLATRFNLRARTSFLKGLGLSQYSEFGLIVSALAVSKGWLGEEWLIAFAIAISFSFFASAPINQAAFSLYKRFHVRLQRFESGSRIPEEQPVDASAAEILVFGMGRLGTGAYDLLVQRGAGSVLGFDSNPDVVARHRDAGRNVVLASATDTDFWERLEMSSKKARMVLLALSSQLENRIAVEQLRETGFDGFVSATARYDDEINQLENAGANIAYHALGEAGAGFAIHALDGFSAGEDT